MISVSKIADPKAVKAILSPGMTRRVLEGYCGHRTPAEALAEPGNRFLGAYDDGKCVGFVVLSDLPDGEIAIHLYLRTVGDKTRQVVKCALSYAKFILGKSSVYAFYCRTRRACKMVSDDAGFVDDYDAPLRYSLPDCKDFIWRRVDLK